MNLQIVGIVVGLLLIAGHLVALLQPALCTQWLPKFPRSRVAGIALMSVACVGCLVVTKFADLSEFSPYRNIVMFVILALGVLAIIFLPEFLAVRALGIIALLAANPLLDAAYARPELSRLLLVVLAYAWILLGFFWIGMPYLLRDQIAKLTAVPWRLRTAAVAGLLYGVAVLFCAVVWWGGVRS